MKDTGPLYLWRLRLRQFGFQFSYFGIQLRYFFRMGLLQLKHLPLQIKILRYHYRVVRLKLLCQRLDSVDDRTNPRFTALVAQLRAKVDEVFDGAQGNRNYDLPDETKTTMKKQAPTETNRNVYFATLRRAARPLAESGPKISETATSEDCNEKQTRSRISASAVSRRDEKSR